MNSVRIYFSIILFTLSSLPAFASLEIVTQEGKSFFAPESMVHGCKTLGHFQQDGGSRFFAHQIPEKLLKVIYSMVEVQASKGPKLGLPTIKNQKKFESLISALDFLDCGDLLKVKIADYAKILNDSKAVHQIDRTFSTYDC